MGMGQNWSGISMGNVKLPSVLSCFALGMDRVVSGGGVKRSGTRSYPNVSTAPLCYTQLWPSLQLSSQPLHYHAQHDGPIANHWKLPPLWKRALVRKEKDRHWFYMSIP